VIVTIVSPETLPDVGVIDVMPQFRDGNPSDDELVAVVIRVLLVVAPVGALVLADGADGGAVDDQGVEVVGAGPTDVVRVAVPDGDVVGAVDGGVGVELLLGLVGLPPV
jgi:hypothetical protein